MASLTGITRASFDSLDIGGNDLTTLLNNKQATIDANNRLDATLLANGNVTNTELDRIQFLTANAMSQFTIAGDTAATRIIQNSNTLSVLGGTALNTAVSSVDTITINLDDTAVTPASYTNANLTVDQQGRITSCSNGTGGGGSTTITVQGDTGGNQDLTDGDNIKFEGGNVLSTISAPNNNKIIFNLDDTAVTPASYTNANITVDQQGRLTAASSGSTITIVDSVADNNQNAVTSNAVYDALQNKQDTLTFNAPSSNNSNPSTSSQIKGQLDLKQDILTNSTSLDVGVTTCSELNVANDGSPILVIHDTTGNNQGRIHFKSSSFETVAGVHFADSGKYKVKFANSFSTADTAFVIDRNNKVGLNLTNDTPLEILDVNGNIYLPTSDSAIFFMSNGEHTAGQKRLKISRDDNNSFIDWQHGSLHLRHDNNSSMDDLMEITSGGLVTGSCVVTTLDANTANDKLVSASAIKAYVAANSGGGGSQSLSITNGDVGMFGLRADININTNNGTVTHQFGGSVTDTNGITHVNNTSTFTVTESADYVISIRLEGTGGQANNEHYFRGVLTRTSSNINRDYTIGSQGLYRDDNNLRDQLLIGGTFRLFLNQNDTFVIKTIVMQASDAGDEVFLESTRSSVFLEQIKYTLS